MRNYNPIQQDDPEYTCMAFPHANNSLQVGMTLRDHFAGEVLPALIINNPDMPGRQLVHDAYAYANWMLLEREL